jgi:hypothetical protein
MSTLNEYAAKLDVELFDLIALTHKPQHRKKKILLKRLHKFLFSADHISACMLVVVMPGKVLSDLVDYNFDIVPHIVKFTKTHSIPKVHKMLAVRYADDLRRLELRVGSEKYDEIVYHFKGE